MALPAASPLPPAPNASPARSCSHSSLMPSDLAALCMQTAAKQGASFESQRQPSADQEELPPQLATAISAIAAIISPATATFGPRAVQTMMQQLQQQLVPSVLTTETFPLQAAPERAPQPRTQSPASPASPVEGPRARMASTSEGSGSSPSEAEDMQMLAWVCEQARAASKSTSPAIEDEDSTALDHLCDLANVRCTICTKTFCTVSYLRRHVRIHTGVRPFACDTCQKTFPDRSGLRAHMRVHTNNRPHTCDECGKGFSKRSHLKTHMLLHTGEKPFPCETCGKTFSQQSNLRTHMRTHTGEKPFVCSLCDRAFAVSSALRAHERLHSEPRSSVRPYVPSPLPAEAAEAEVEALPSESESEDTDDDGTYTPVTTTPLSSTPAMPLDSSFSDSLYNPCASSSMKDDKRPHVCPTCNKSFGYGFVLTKHMRTHTGERPYLCDVCPKRFSDFSTLRNHRRIHTGEKPYDCKACGRCFRQIGQLRTHMRIHDNERE